MDMNPGFAPPSPGGPSPGLPHGIAVRSPRTVTVTAWHPGQPTGDLSDIAWGVGMTVRQLLQLPMNRRYRNGQPVVAGDVVQTGWD
jgi:hypothetical protein